MKYPLATVNQLLQDFGSDICLGYDIWCAFITTLRKSSLGQKAVALFLPSMGMTIIVAVRCNGTLYVKGVGLEDFKEYEHTFCHSNELASVTCLATPYHRQQHIDKHFRFHNLDKHIASGKSSPF